MNFQGLDESYLGYALNDHNNITSGNRRGSLGLELEAPLDESNLKRAISCESVCSDTSVNLNDLETPIVGHICVGLEYERWGGRGSDCEGDLAVSVLEARDLVTTDSSPAQDTFVRFDIFIYTSCTLFITAIIVIDILNMIAFLVYT